ncbi:MAG: hypothetical protein ACTHK8_23135, partial [Ginsengibacter sp.]
PIIKKDRFLIETGLFTKPQLAFGKLLHIRADHHLARHLLAFAARNKSPEPVFFSWYQSFDGAAAGGANCFHPHALFLD